LEDAMADDVLSHYSALDAGGTERFLNSYIELLPSTCTEANNARLADLSSEFASYRPVLSKRFLELQQEDERCVSIRGLLQ